MTEQSSLNGQVAVVTGAADGIGWAIAQHLAKAGSQVALLDLNGDQARERATQLGSVHLGIACNVTSEADVQAAVSEVLSRCGCIDTLVNNAGIGEQAGATLIQDADRFDRVVSVHLRGTFLMCRAVATAMLERRSGAIVNLGSIAGQAGIPGRNAYGAAKAGIAAMTRSMAAEWARSGVRVNCVAPGYVLTSMVSSLIEQGAIDAAGVARRTPMGRMALPEEIASAVEFLASARASFITGVVLPVDGGWLALGAPESVLGDSQD